MENEVHAAEGTLLDLPRSMPRELNAAVEWAYHRLTAGVRKPAIGMETEIKAALRKALGHSRHLRIQSSRFERKQPQRTSR
jgi:hypothetical protein